jgi:hypothetical protein
MRLYVYSGKSIPAAMYLRRVVIDGRSYAAAPTQAPKVVTPPAPAAKNLGVKMRGGRDATAAGDKQLGSCVAGNMKYSALCVEWKVNPRGDVSSASWNRWP